MACLMIECPGRPWYICPLLSPQKALLASFFSASHEVQFYRCILCAGLWLIACSDVLPRGRWRCGLNDSGVGCSRILGRRYALFLLSPPPRFSTPLVSGGLARSDPARHQPGSLSCSTWRRAFPESPILHPHESRLRDSPKEVARLLQHRLKPSDFGTDLVVTACHGMDQPP